MATFRHKRIARFKIGPFEFRDHLLTIKTKEEEKQFRKLMDKQPNQVRALIVEVNEEALASLEKPMTRSVRGATQASDVPAPSKNPEGQRVVAEGETSNPPKDKTEPPADAPVQTEPESEPGSEGDESLPGTLTAASKPNPAASLKSASKK